MAGVTFVLTGDKELDRTLRELKKSVVKKITSPAVNKALTIMAKGIRAQVPAKYKKIKTLVGKRYNKAKTGESRGMIVAKVGIGVGLKRTQKRKGVVVANKKFSSGDRTGKGGVGLSANNVHWFLLGTESRTTKSGASRGRMSPLIEGLVKAGIAATESQAKAEMVNVIRERIKAVGK